MTKPTKTVVSKASALPINKVKNGGGISKVMSINVVHSISQMYFLAV